MEKYYKLRSWIDINKLNWVFLSKNPNAIHLLENNLDKINWTFLSENPILENNLEKICWYELSKNPNAIEILKNNIDKIIWSAISENPNIFILDYNIIKQHNLKLNCEIIQASIHPSRVIKRIENNIEF